MEEVVSSTPEVITFAELSIFSAFAESSSAVADSSSLALPIFSEFSIIDFKRYTILFCAVFKEVPVCPNSSERVIFISDEKSNCAKRFARFFIFTRGLCISLAINSPNSMDTIKLIIINIVTSIKEELYSEILEL